MSAIDEHAEPLPDHLDEMIAQTVARLWAEQDLTGAKSKRRKALDESVQIYLPAARAHVSGSDMRAMFAVLVLKDLFAEKEWAVEFESTRTATGRVETGRLMALSQSHAEEIAEEINAGTYLPGSSHHHTRRDAHVVYSYRTTWRQP